MKHSSAITNGSVETGWTFRGKILGRYQDGVHVTLYPYGKSTARAVFPVEFYFKLTQVSTNEFRTFDPDIARHIDDTITTQRDLLLESKRLG